MTDDTFDPNEAANSLLQVMEALTVIEQTARGYRTSLVAEGWSEPIAEQVAADLLINLNRKAFE